MFDSNAGHININVTLMDKYELCRLCALKHNNLLSIYGEEGIRLSIEQKIKKCLNIKLNVNNPPNSICAKCLSKLDAFDEFLDIAHKAQVTLNIVFSESGISHLNAFGSEEGLKDVGNSINEDGKTETYNIHNITDVNNPNNINIGDVGCPEDSVSLTDNCSLNTKSVLIESDNNERIHNNSFNLGIEEEKNKDWDLHTWLCCDCSEEFPCVEDLRHHHESEHKQEPKYMCAYCSKLFHLYSAFTTHLKRHKYSFKHNCNECGKSFTNKKVLETHSLTHSDARHYSCQDCGKAFRQQSALYIHTRCHLPDDIKNIFPCEMCNKRFSTKPNLVNHMRIHTGIKNFTCDQCGKSFIQKGNLNAHLITHSHDKPYFCEICNKRFKTGMQLRKHHSVHTGTKPHQCDICGRTFREKGTLREHHRIHTGAMPFTCEFCGKSFRFKGILTTHRRQHTGERPYSCLECQHHFTNWPNYNKHMKRRHGINTSKSSRVPPSEGEMDNLSAPSDLPAHDFSDIQTDQDGYSQPPLSSYAYSAYGLSQVPLEPLPL